MEDDNPCKATTTKWIQKKRTHKSLFLEKISEINKDFQFPKMRVQISPGQYHLETRICRGKLQSYQKSYLKRKAS